MQKNISIPMTDKMISILTEMAEEEGLPRSIFIKQLIVTALGSKYGIFLYKKQDNKGEYKNFV